VKCERGQKKQVEMIFICFRRTDKKPAGFCGTTDEIIGKSKKERPVGGWVTLNRERFKTLEVCGSEGS